MKVRAGDLVYVETDDIEHHNDGWTPVGDITATKPLTYRAVGWVLKATKRTLVLAPMMAGGPKDRRAFCAYQLPRRAITKIKRLAK